MVINNLNINVDVEEDIVLPNDNASILFEELGDALKYMLTYELSDLAKKHGNGKAVHFYGVLLYLALYGYLSKDRAARAYRIMFMDSRGEGSEENVVHDVSKMLFENLKKKISFSDFDELIEKLNKYVIPNWCFYIGKKFIENNNMIKNAYLIQDVLYFISEKNTLNSISITKIKSCIDLTNDALVVVDDFSNIVGIDENLFRIYTAMEDNRYAYYDIVANELVIGKDSFFALVEGSLFIIKDNQIALVMGDATIHTIKEYFPSDECYAPRENYFYIYPKEKGNFFAPYNLYFDGKIQKAEETACKRVVWNYMTSKIMDDKYDLFNLNSKPQIPMPKLLSIDAMLKGINDVLPIERRCKNIGFVLLKNTLDILAKYFDRSIEDLDLLYALAIADSKLVSECELYWRIKVLENKEIKNDNNRLATLLKSRDYKKLIQDILCDQKPKERCETQRKEKTLIGFFQKREDEIISTPIELSQGMPVGSQIIPKINYNNGVFGFVTFDIRLKKHYVHSKRSLSSSERLCLANDFNINLERENESVLFVHLK